MQGEKIVISREDKNIKENGIIPSMPIMREQEGGSDGSRFNRAVGPFYSPGGVLKRLSIDQKTLGEMAQTGQILALPTAEGQLVYPIRQFFSNEDGRVMVNPAVVPAMRYLMKHEDDSIDLLFQVDSPYGLLWTIAGALLQPDDRGETLLHTLQQHLDNPEHESWQRLHDLNGVISGIKKVLSEPHE